MPDYSHCLRKSFTDSLYKKLKSGDSINIIGQRHNGQQRLLEDIAQLARQEGITALEIDMNKWKHHYAGFVDAVHDQLGQSMQTLSSAVLPAPTDSSKALPAANQQHLSKVLSQQIINHKQILLLLNNYDALLDNPKQRFPKSFFDDLNSLRNKANLSLCVLTEKSHLQYKVYYEAEDGKTLDNKLSWLDLDIIELPKPTMSEIREELHKRLDSVSLWEKEPEQEQFVNALHNHTAFHQFLSIVCNSFSMNHEAMDAKKRLYLCHKQYGNHYHRVDKFEWGKPFARLKDLIEWGLDQYAKIKSK